MKKLCCLLLFSANLLTAQINFTANDVVPVYTESFGFGVNPGYNINWTDEQLADISAGNPALNIPGAGINCFRPTLPEWFLEQWGYDIRLSTFQHYENLGMRDHTVFIGYASDVHRDTTHFCSEHQSNLFLNMYEPIWDNGINGTPVNEENYYASYVYQMVNLYKDYVGFWEVWNEPDFDYSGNGWKPPGMEDNWWENVPEPCDYSLRAPVFHYIRLLRISYEVIKYIDPEAFVAIGGIGYPSFLDLVMRHSDNPDGGTISGEFPLTGGAYFDALSYHSYPHFDGSLRYWSNDIGAFVYTRHSDAAALGVISRKQALNDVLSAYGYNETTFPEKKWLITESNLPSKSFDPEFLGTHEAARNFIIKTVVQCQKNDILQYHVYNLADLETCEDATYEFQQMGLYEKISGMQPYDQNIKHEGIALKTISDAIAGAFYSETHTAALQLPPELDGGAFEHPNGRFTYVLWAITETDLSEEAEAEYTFPESLGINHVIEKAWHASRTGIIDTLENNLIPLSGSPAIFESIEIQNPVSTNLLDEGYKFNIFPNPFSKQTNIQIELPVSEKVQVYIKDVFGNKVNTLQNQSTLDKGKYSYIFKPSALAPGIYFCHFEIKNQIHIIKLVYF